MNEQQMANYTLTIQADSGYESTTEGRCTAEQYGQAMAALHGTSPAQRKPLSVDEIFEAIRPLYSSDKAAWLAVNHSKDEYRAIEAAHNIKENT